MNRPRIAAASAVASLALVAAYSIFSAPESVVVSEAGNVVGPVNVIREKIQGKSFWDNQLHLAQSELAELLSRPQRMAKLDQEMEKVLQDNVTFMEGIYKEHPELRPVPASLLAQELRRKADQIEASEVSRLVEQSRIEKIGTIRRTLVAILRRVMAGRGDR